MVARKTNRIIESVAYALQNSPSSCAAAINCRKKCLEWLVIVILKKTGSSPSGVKGLQEHGGKEKPAKTSSRVEKVVSSGVRIFWLRQRPHMYTYTSHNTHHTHNGHAHWTLSHTEHVAGPNRKQVLLDCCLSRSVQHSVMWPHLHTDHTHITHSRLWPHWPHPLTVYTCFSLSLYMCSCK